MDLYLWEGCALRCNELSRSTDCKRLSGANTTLKLHVSVPSQLQDHASLSADGTLTAESEFIIGWLQPSTKFGLALVDIELPNDKMSS